MLIFTKYSNERDMEFRIRTDIMQDPDGTRWIRKVAAVPQAWRHIQKIYERSLWLKKDLCGTGFSVNECEVCREGVRFPYLEGRTLEERLDDLLKKKKTEELLAETERYFAMFAQNGLKEFQVTPEFVQIFGDVRFAQKQYSRAVSDVDMIFSNAIEQEEEFVLIDYEWTFDFPIPVKFIQYRCLYYYILGNAARDELTQMNLYQRFGISEAEQVQFAAMENRFQQYILGNYTPLWKQYDDISDGVIDVASLVSGESVQKRFRIAEVFFDDGRGFGTWNCRRYHIQAGAGVSLKTEVSDKTRSVRIDPCDGKCVARVEKLTLNGKPLSYESNGALAGNGDLIFDTEDPQIVFAVDERGIVEAQIRVEPLQGISRELVLNQHGRIRWMEQTKVWKLYQKMKGMTGRKN